MMMRRDLPLIVITTTVMAVLAITVASTAVAASKPKLLAPPWINSRAGLLFLNTGRWDQPQASTRFQWQRCSKSGSHCLRIPGAEGLIWEPVARDAGHRLRAVVTASDGRYSSTAITQPTARISRVRGPTAVAGDPVVQAAGDVACAPEEPVTRASCHQQQTANLLSVDDAAILVLGDTQYDCGEANAYTSFDSTWGRFKSLLRPVVGNHEYQTTGGDNCPGDASGYFGYFGSAAGLADMGYYSFDIGNWHIVALNSECEYVSCAAGSPQETWLRADLAATKQPCILAMWHKPRFVSTVTRPEPQYKAFWVDLYGSHTDVVLNGHIHEYARFAASDPSGQPARHGIRQFIVGTGGKDFYPETYIRAGSLVADFQNTTFGVLRLALHQDGYDW